MGKGQVTVDGYGQVTVEGYGQVTVGGYAQVTVSRGYDQVTVGVEPVRTPFKETHPSDSAYVFILSLTFKENDVF